MSAIVVSDIHQTSRESDAHRWKIFDWLLNQEADDLLILGDLTDAKDNHSSKLVNHLVYVITELCRKFNKIIILKGNHDYIDPDCPFFMFLDIFRNNIRFIMEPEIQRLTIGNAVFVPSGTDWSTLPLDTYPGSIDYIFAHCTFNGAQAESGSLLKGIDPEPLLQLGIPVISGDIHKPQIIGGIIEYVGSPYHTRFGDDFTPRVLFIDNSGARKNLFFPSKRKYVVEITSLEELERLSIKRGEQVRIKLRLSRAEMADWKERRRDIIKFANEKQWELFGPVPELIPVNKGIEFVDVTTKQPHELIENYVAKHKASKKHEDIGKELLE